MPNPPQRPVPHAWLRQGAVSYDHQAGEYVADHSTAANPPLRPFAPRQEKRWPAAALRSPHVR